jgi:methoxymalonate biosynthesis acyl carrier protein
MDDRRAYLRAFVRQRLQDNRIGDGDDFFADCGASSMFAMQLILYIEEQFGVEIDDDDLEIDNFRTVEALDNFVARKTARTSA